MTRAFSSGALSLVFLGGCGLVVDLPEARIDAPALVATGGKGSGDGSGGSSDGGGAGSNHGDGDEAGDGDGDAEVSSGGSDGSGGGTSMGGESPQSGGARAIDEPETGGTSSGGNNGCPAPCDCDGDGALRDDVACAGTDCDDDDARVFPGQTQFFAEPANEQIGFDYNCDGQIQRSEGNTQAIDCALISLGSCSSVQGFQQVPACGGRGDWGKCVPGTLTCDWSVLEESRVVRCH